MDSKIVFGRMAAGYSKFRPNYPEILFEWLAETAPATGFVADIATGTGQAAAALSRHFDHVIASDASAEQIKHALSMPNVTYSVADAGHIDVDDETLDAIVVAQALHWFAGEAFWSVVKRKLKRDGVFLAFGYGWMSTGTELDDILISRYRDLVHAYWNSNNALLWEGYGKTIRPFPFKVLRPPDCGIAVDWSVQEIFDYMTTWSASHAFVQDQGIEPLERLLADVARQYSLSDVFAVKMPLTILAGAKQERSDL